MRVVGVADLIVDPIALPGAVTSGFDVTDLRERGERQDILQVVSLSELRRRRRVARGCVIDRSEHCLQQLLGERLPRSGQTAYRTAPHPLAIVLAAGRLAKVRRRFTKLACRYRGRRQIVDRRVNRSPLIWLRRALAGLCRCLERCLKNASSVDPERVILRAIEPQEIRAWISGSGETRMKPTRERDDVRQAGVDRVGL